MVRRFDFAEKNPAQHYRKVQILLKYYLLSDITKFEVKLSFKKASILPESLAVKKQPPGWTSI